MNPMDTSAVTADREVNTTPAAMHHDPASARRELAAWEALHLEERQALEQRHAYLYAGGRLLLGVLFILMALDKSLNFHDTVTAVAGTGYAGAPLLAGFALSLELIAGVLLVLGLRARIAAGWLSIYLVTVTIMFNWDLSLDVNRAIALANLGFVAALLMVIAHGAGATSFERVPRPATGGAGPGCRARAGAAAVGSLTLEAQLLVPSHCGSLLRPRGLRFTQLALPAETWLISRSRTGSHVHAAQRQRAHPQLLDHRAHRSRQVDARRSPARGHRHRHRAREAGPVPRQHGPGARARHHHQGADGAHGLHGRRTARTTSSTSSTRPGTSTSPTRSRARSPPARARCWSSTPRRASRRRRSPTSTWRSTTTSRSSRSSTRSTCPRPTSRARARRSRRSSASTRSEAVPGSAKEGIGIHEILEAIVQHVPPPKRRSRRRRSRP